MWVAQPLHSPPGQSHFLIMLNYHVYLEPEPVCWLIVF